MVVNDYATRKKYLSHAVEYELIFHGTRIGKYYCKKMKYRINIAYYMSMSGIWLVISRVASYFHEPKVSANTAYE